MNKYKVKCKGQDIDVYDVLKAFDVKCPATQHAVKKLLKAGQRGAKDVDQDLIEAVISLERARELNKEQTDYNIQAEDEQKECLHQYTYIGTLQAKRIVQCDFCGTINTKETNDE